MNVGCKNLTSQVNKLGLLFSASVTAFHCIFLRYNFQQRSARQLRFHGTKSAVNLLHYNMMYEGVLLST